jgi:hypothetical protein
VIKEIRNVAKEQEHGEFLVFLRLLKASNERPFPESMS